MNDATTVPAANTGDVEHPNMAAPIRAGELITNGFDQPDEGLFADGFVFHYFNTRLPELTGDHHGLVGIRALFERLHSESDGTFRVDPVSLTPFGDELVAAYATVHVTFGGAPLEIDSLVVWRVVGGQIHEAWDIPAVNTVRVGGLRPTAEPALT